MLIQFGSKQFLFRFALLYNLISGNNKCTNIELFIYAIILKIVWIESDNLNNLAEYSFCGGGGLNFGTLGVCPTNKIACEKCDKT